MRIIEKNNLNIEFCCGQGYDGAANMSSQAVGLQKRVKKLFTPIAAVTI